MNKYSSVIIPLILILSFSSIVGAELSAKELIVPSDDLEIVNVNIETNLNLKVEDSNGKNIDYLAEVGNSNKILKMFDSKFETGEKVKEGNYKVNVQFESGPVKSISFDDLKITTSEIILGLDSVPNEKITTHDFVKTYAIDPEMLPFTRAVVSVKAKGNALYKCKAWNFKGQSCEGDWKFLQAVTPGEVYSFELTPNDPGFGEINATDALHLDENYTLINNIFDEIKTKDGIWSEPIFTNEYVRVTFEDNLTNGRMIDIYARSNDTLTYFEIYEAETTHLVGKSGVIGYPEVQFMTINNLTEPTDVFDFKIVNVEGNISDYRQCVMDGYSECDEDPYDTCYVEVEEECDSPIYHPDRTAFVEFDFIHDDVINSSHADGLFCYGEANIASPRYRLWDDTNDSGTEQSGNSIGVDGTNDITWAIVKGSHERNELIMGTYDKGNDINVQIYDSVSWTNLTEITATAENSAYRGFDIEYEDISGDALIVYENSDVPDSVIAYRTWNGTAISSETTLTTDLASGEVRWISLTKNVGSDNIMLLVLNDLTGLWAIPWNGTGFESTLALTVSTLTTSSTEQHFDFAWEESSEQGLIFYGEGTDLVYRTYDPVGGFGVIENTIALGNSLDVIRTCSDPTSDYIGVIVQDSGNDVNVRVWDGSSLLASAPSQDGSTEANGGNNGNVDCAWLNSTTALFGFVDRNQLRMDWFTFTKANTWSTSDLTSTSSTSNFAPDDIKSLRFVKHPTTQEVMITAMDIDEYVTVVRWTGTAIEIPVTSTLETLTEVSNGAQEGVMFDWYRYDPVPNVTLVKVNDSSLSPSEPITINATVVDNIELSSVRANITLPNSTIEQITLTDENSDNNYNLSYVQTGLIGTYTVTIVANDTSVHQNINGSETTSFTVADVNNPTVNESIPVLNSVFNISNSTELSVNVTDDSGVSVVIANVSYPNGTNNELVLSNIAGDKYNTSFVLPYLIGNYNITFFANDTSGNENNTEVVNFTINDVVKPNVTNGIPTLNTVFNVSNTTEISINITDDLSVDVVIANVSYPNGTNNELVLSNIAGDKYNTSFVLPYLIGNYNITFFANDTSGNENNTGVVNFTINDVVKPNVTITTPGIGSNFFAGTIVNMSVTSTDDIAIDVVLVNVSLPNGTIIQSEAVYNSTQTRYNATLDSTLTEGTYTITAIVNDTSNNINSSVTRTFNVQDSTAPLVTLVSPTDNSFETSSTFNYTCNSTDSSGLANITLYNNISGSFIANGTVDVIGILNETNFTISGVEEGIYLWNCLSADSNGLTSFAVSNYTVTVDTTSPAVSNFVPALNDVYNVSNSLNISVAISESYTVDTAIANISYPNGTTLEVILIDGDSDNAYNTTYTIPSLIGVYNVTFFANDTNGNENNTETSNFTVNDVNSLAIGTLSCTPSSANLTQTVICNATVSDDIGVHIVTANVTMSNGTVLSQAITNVSSNYSFSFTDTSQLTGTYNVSWESNDTSSNTQNTTTNFTISDVIYPKWFLYTPVNEINSSTSSINFNFSVEDDFDTSINCSLMIDGIIDQTNGAVSNATYTTFSKSGIADGTHTWGVQCNDNSPNTNTSSTRNFNVDTTDVTFVYLDTNPNTVDDLDPGVVVNVTSNVTDSLTGVHTVLMQYMNTNDTDFTNVTMDVNSSSIYNASFTAVGNTTYTVRIWANDSAGNEDFSTNTSLIIALDQTWTRTPSSYPATFANLSENVSVGDIIIQNTGDYDLNFTITSTLNTTYFNESVSNVAVSSGANFTFNFNASTSSAGTTAFVIMINSSNETSPEQRNTTVNLVAAAGQPVIVATIITIPENVTQGQTGVELVAKLENIGEGDFYNGTLNFTLPNDWTVTFGDTDITISELLAGEEIENTIEVDISSSAAIGSKTVLINGSGVNNTGENIHELELFFANSYSVNVNEQTNLGSGSGGGGGGGSSGTAGSSGSGGGGGGSVERIGSGETISTTETYTVVRGSDAEIPIIVSNFYEHAYFTNVELEVQGFMSQYVTVEEIGTFQSRVYVDSVNIEKGPNDEMVTLELNGLNAHNVEVMDVNLRQATFTFYSDPVEVTVGIGETQEVDLNGNGRSDIAVEYKDMINGNADFNVYKLGIPTSDKVQYKEERKYLLRIFAPAYVQEEDYNLTVAIKAKIVPFNTRLAGFNYKPLVEFRTLLFKVIKISPESAQKKIDKAKGSIREMKEKDFPTIKLEAWVREAEVAFEKEDFGIAASLAEQVLEESGRAFNANDLISETSEWIYSAKDKWLTVEETEKALVLAIKAFEREDFSASLERAKEAQLIYIIETKGRVNVVWFVGKYWWAIILSLIGLAIVSFFSYKRFVVAVINQRLKNLAREEVSLNSLIKEVQHQHLEERSISAAEFHISMAQYESRLNKIQRIRTKLRNKKVGFMRTEQEIINLKKEEHELMDMMKDLQIKYLQKGIISKQKFTSEYTQDKEALADVDEEIELLTEKLELEKVGRKYKVLSKVNKTSIMCGAFFKNILGNIRKNKEDRVVRRLEKKKTAKVEEYNKKQKKEKNNKNISDKRRKEIYDMLDKGRDKNNE